MLQPVLLAFLRCPEDRSELSPADAEVVNKINVAIRAGKLRNRAGRTLETSIDGGLLRARGDHLYPIVDEIPILLREEAIAIEQLEAATV